MKYKWRKTETANTIDRRERERKRARGGETEKERKVINTTQAVSSPLSRA